VSPRCASRSAFCSATPFASTSSRRRGVAS
jgi:hypothetical protein